MIDANDLPATMPGSIKEQLLALAPFMINHSFKMNGGFVVDLRIPIESFLTFDINHEALNEHNMSISLQVESREPSFDGKCGIIREPRYVDAQLTYL